MQTVKVKMWDSSKGFGFIIDENDDELYVNAVDLHPSVINKMLREGQTVKYDIRTDIKGDRAVNVKVVK